MFPIRNTLKTMKPPKGSYTGNIESYNLNLIRYGGYYMPTWNMKKKILLRSGANMKWVHYMKRRHFVQRKIMDKVYLSRYCGREIKDRYV